MWIRWKIIRTEVAQFKQPLHDNPSDIHRKDRLFREHNGMCQIDIVELLKLAFLSRQAWDVVVFDERFRRRRAQACFA